MTAQEIAQRNFDHLALIMGLKSELLKPSETLGSKLIANANLQLQAAGSQPISQDEAGMIRLITLYNSSPGGRDQIYFDWPTGWGYSTGGAAYGAFPLRQGGYVALFTSNFRRLGSYDADQAVWISSGQQQPDYLPPDFWVRIRTIGSETQSDPTLVQFTDKSWRRRNPLTGNYDIVIPPPQNAVPLVHEGLFGTPPPLGGTIFTPQGVPEDVHRLLGDLFNRGTSGGGGGTQ